MILNFYIEQAEMVLEYMMLITNKFMKMIIGEGCLLFKLKMITYLEVIHPSHGEKIIRIPKSYGLKEIELQCQILRLLLFQLLIILSIYKPARIALILITQIMLT